MYWFGTYVRAIETVLLSCISFASLRAISTGWTFDLNVLLKAPSKRPSSFCSRFRRMLTARAILGDLGLRNRRPADAGGPGGDGRDRTEHGAHREAARGLR